VDVRYWALLTAGSLPFAELLDGVQRGVFDPNPDVASAARIALAALKKLPQVDGILKGLRRELTASDSGRRALAARALGALHDRESIDGLIGLAGSENADCAQAASDALKEITKASCGTSARQWSLWWAENRERPRSQWLVAGLRHPELDVRLASIDELAAAFGDKLGYLADGPVVEREAAAHRWTAKLQKAEAEQT